MKLLYKGDIYFADLSPVVGSEQGGVRPVLVIQNNVGNKFSPTVIVAAITSRMDKHNLPTHVLIEQSRYGLQKDSMILLEQVRTIDKRRLREHMGHVDDHLMNQIDSAIAVSFDHAAADRSSFQNHRIFHKQNPPAQFYAGGSFAITETAGQS